MYFPQTKKLRSSGTEGFSLVELMVVVAIIGILASIAMPRYDKFKARAHQSEAKVSLSQIYTLQTVAYIEADKYVDMDAYGKGSCTPSTKLGFRIDNCPGAKYTYTVVATPTTFTARASTGTPNGIYPRCADGEDVWEIDDLKRIKPIVDIVKECKKASGQSTSGGTGGTTGGTSGTTGTTGSTTTTTSQAVINTSDAETTSTTQTTTTQTQTNFGFTFGPPP